MSLKPLTAMNVLRTLRRTAVPVLLLASACAYADDDCETPMAEWQPRAAVLQLAERSGWQIRRLKIDDGCYEIKGRDAEGRRFKAKLDPATLEIVSMKRERHGSGPDEHTEHRRRSE